MFLRNSGANQCPDQPTCQPSGTCPGECRRNRSGDHKAESRQEKGCTYCRKRTNNSAGGSSNSAANSRALKRLASQLGFPD